MSLRQTVSSLAARSASSVRALRKGYPPYIRATSAQGGVMIPAVRPALLLVGIAATVGLVLLALLLLSAPGANAQTDTLLVKNTNQSVDFEVNFGGAVRSRAQVFETGPHARGYRNPV